MTLLIVIAGVAFFSLLLIWWGTRAGVAPVRQFAEVKARFKPVDLQSFQNLIDPAQDQYLRRALDGRAFRLVQRARRAAAIEYLWLLAHNAGLLIRAGECAKASGDPGTSSLARGLIAEAVTTRTLALLAIAKISLGIVPEWRASCDSFLERYKTTTAKYLQLGLASRSGSQTI